VLLWQPGTKTEDTIAITFPTSDLKGKFKLEICANSKDGKLFSKQQFFDVK
jgi:hypothetical protein